MIYAGNLRVYMYVHNKEYKFKQTYIQIFIRMYTQNPSHLFLNNEMKFPQNSDQIQLM